MLQFKRVWHVLHLWVTTDISTDLVVATAASITDESACQHALPAHRNVLIVSNINHDKCWWSLS